MHRLGRRLPHRRVQAGVVDLEPLADGLPQGLSDPLVQIMGEICVQAGVTGQGRAKTGDTAGMFDQTTHGRIADVGGPVRRQGRHGHGIGLIHDRLYDPMRQVRPPRHGDLMLQRGLQQDPDQVRVLQQGAGGDDRRRDLDLVQRQHVDQSRRGPIRCGEAFGQQAANIPLGLGGQGQEDFRQGGRQGGVRRRGFAQGDHAQQQSPTVVRRLAARQVDQIQSGFARGRRRSELGDSGQGGGSDAGRYRLQL